MKHIVDQNFLKQRQNPTFLRSMVYCFIPAHVWHIVKSELLAFRVRLNSRVERQKAQKMNDVNINVGCGNINESGWVNVDVFSAPNIDIVFDCRRELPFRNNSVNAIFCEHMLEHLDYTEDVPVFLSECRRVLKDDGILRVVVPDAEKYIRAYLAEGWDKLAAVRSLKQNNSDIWTKNQYRSKIEVINEVFRQHYQHKWAYDFDNLKNCLIDTGFKTITKKEFGDSDIAIKVPDTPNRQYDSLYVEAKL